MRISYTHDGYIQIAHCTKLYQIVIRRLLKPMISRYLFDLRLALHLRYTYLGVWVVVLRQEGVCKVHVKHG